MPGVDRRRGAYPPLRCQSGGAIANATISEALPDATAGVDRFRIRFRGSFGFSQFGVIRFFNVTAGGRLIRSKPASHFCWRPHAGGTAEHA